MDNNYNRSHIIVPVPSPIEYKSKGTPIESVLPNRDRKQHARALMNQLKSLEQAIDHIKKQRELNGFEGVEGVLLTIKGMPEHDLLSDGIQSKREKIEIVNKGISTKGEEFAVVRLQKADLKSIEKKVIEYETKTSDKGNPSHSPLISGIEEIKKSVLQEFWVGELNTMPPLDDTMHWWEVWLIGGKKNPSEARLYRSQFELFANKGNIEFDPNYRIDFADRQVFLIKASGNQISFAISNLDCISELRLPSKGVKDWYVSKGGITLSLTAPSNILPPSANAATVTLLDTGIEDQHPLLKLAIAPNGLHTIDPSSPYTNDYDSHGTGMAGVVLYDDLSKVLTDDNFYTLPAQVESVRIQLTDETQRSLWGNTTERAVLKAETGQVSRRIYCMAIGAESLTQGKPSSWSGTVDKLIYNDGNHRLMVIAAGNVRPLDLSGYPTRNLATLLHDPAQARNAISVGAMCEFDQVSNPPSISTVVFAKKGELSPHSRTHVVNNDAIKPDIVCEGGNVAWDGSMACVDLEGLAILTTYTDYIKNDPFNLIGGTSPAAAEASRMLAQIWESNPNLRAETVRGLLIHSATWTEAMLAQFPVKRDLLRSCGYGVPNVVAACRSASSAVTLISEGEIRPYYRDRIMGSRGRMKFSNWKRDIILFDLPWPEDELNKLGELPIELRVTLSYFAEPNPKNVLRAYEGMGLQWELQRSDETNEQFAKRVNVAARNEGENGFESPKDWKIGIKARSRGTVQSDRWNGMAVELASRRKLAVYPTGGWWRATPSEHPNQPIPFSLIVSVTTGDVNVDLYNKISLKVSTTDVSVDA